MVDSLDVLTTVIVLNGLTILTSVAYAIQLWMIKKRRDVKK